MIAALLFTLVLLMVLGTSIWVLIDANRIGITGGKGGLLSNTPTVWFIGCVLLWIVAFPLYLVARSQHLEARAIVVAGGSSIAIPAKLPGDWMGSASVGLGVASIPVGVLLGIFAVPLWMSGLVLGLVAVTRRGPGRKTAAIGIALNIVGAIVMTCAIIAMAILMTRTGASAAR